MTRFCTCKSTCWWMKALRVQHVNYLVHEVAFSKICHLFSKFTDMKFFLFLVIVRAKVVERIAKLIKLSNLGCTTDQMCTQLGYTYIEIYSHSGCQQPPRILSNVSKKMLATQLHFCASLVNWMFDHAIQVLKILCTYRLLDLCDFAVLLLCCRQLQTSSINLDTEYLRRYDWSCLICHKH